MKRYQAFLAAAVFFSHGCWGQSISSVNPTNADVGTQLTVTITCANDNFLTCIQVASWPSCNSTVNRVYFKDGDSICVASSVSNIQSTSLSATVGFPLSSSAGLWDVEVEHLSGYGGTVSLAQGFAVNPITAPVLDSISPKSSFLNRNLVLIVHGTHTHFQVFQQGSLVNNVTSVWLKRAAASIQAVGVSPTDYTTLQASFTLPASGDTGMYDVEVDQGNGLASATLHSVFHLEAALHASGTLPKGCIAYYPFDGDAVDYSNSGNDGTMYNAADTPGVSGRALYFNGSNSYVLVPNNGGFPVTGGLSICAWIKPDLNNAWHEVVAKFNAASSDLDWGLGEAMAGGVYFSIWQGSTQYSTNGKNTLALDVWTHIAGTWDGAVMRIYQNGVLQPESVQVAPPANNSSRPLYIGLSPSNSFNFKGAVDEVMIFDRALSAAEIDSVYQGVYTVKPGSDSTVPVLVPFQPKVTLNRRPALFWHPVKGASAYTLSVATDMSFVNLVVQAPQSDTSYAPGANMPLGTIYWRVKSDLSARWSAADRFIIQSDTVPFLVRFSGDTIRSLRPKFVWNKVALANAYRIEVAGTPSFGTNAIATLVSDTTFTPLADLAAGTSYWHVSCDRNYAIFSPPDNFFAAAPSRVAGQDPFDRVLVSLGRGSQGCELRLYSLDGRRAATIPSVNSHARVEDLVNAPGSRLAAGVYLAVLQKNGAVMAAKMVLRR